jgi:hypothetical protein
LDAYSRSKAEVHRRPLALGRKDTPATVIVAEENEGDESRIRRPFDTHKPVLLVATMAKVRNPYAVRPSNPFLDKGGAMIFPKGSQMSPALRVTTA